MVKASVKIAQWIKNTFESSNVIARPHIPLPCPSPGLGMLARAI